MVASDAVVEEKTKNNAELLAASILQSKQSADRGRGDLYGSRWTEVSTRGSFHIGRCFQRDTGLGVREKGIFALRTRLYLRNVNRREHSCSPNAEPGDQASNV